jgi:hypothetical protein
MRAVDTLHARHRTLDAPAYHLNHDTIKGGMKGIKLWDGQGAELMAADLALRYARAFNDRTAMRKLVNGG